MEWLIEPNVSMIINDCRSYTPTCGHKCANYCGTKDGCPIYACASRGCTDYTCIAYYG